MNEKDFQDEFLTTLKRERMPVTFFLMNGFQMRGIVAGHDAFTVILDCEGKQNLIYKHAISTIQPIRPISLATTTSDEHEFSVKGE